MVIAVLGATGFVGKVLVRQLLEAGIRVKSLVRDPEKLGELKARVDYTVGSAERLESLKAVIGGSDAVISTLAPSKTNPGDPRVYEGIMRNVVAAMESAGVERLVHIGGAGYRIVDGERWQFSRRFLRAMLLLLQGPIMEAKRLEWQVIRGSSLAWTLVRPPAILPKREGRPLVADERLLSSLSVDVESLARFLVDAARSGEWIGKAPLVSNSARR